MLIEKNQRSFENNKGCFRNFWFVFLIGWALVIILFYDLYLNKCTQDWTPIEATVENVEIKTGTSSSHTYFYLRAEYMYQIDGTSYNGNCLAKSSFLRNEIKNSRKGKNLMPIFNKFNHAKKIQVYYNPANPKESVVINQITNPWFSLMWFVLVFNSIIYGLKISFERQNKYYLLIPLTVFLLMMYQFVANVQYVDTLAKINVLEEYSPTHCKFAEASFQEHVYIWINNFRMTQNHEHFNRNSGYSEMKIQDKLNNSNSTFKSVAIVNYKNEGTERTIKFSLEYDIVEECEFIYKNIKLLE